MKLTLFAGLLLIVFSFPGCVHKGDKSFMQTKRSYTESFVESDEVKLQYLDWGGSGPVLVLICGLGDTPYLFDDLVQRLSSDLRIIAYARRAHCKSESKQSKYDNATLVGDLKFLLDGLKIDKAHLLGWSLGGNEITAFASRYPDRVGKLVYFEAGYDLSDEAFKDLVKSIPDSFLPDSAGTSSIEAYREWYHHFWFGDMEWNDVLEKNFRASSHINADGRISTIPEDSTFRTILKEAMSYRREYDSVKAPSLVIYAAPFFFPADDKPETVKLYEDIETRIVVPWRTESMNRVKKELKNLVIIEAPLGSHTSFLFRSNEFLAKNINSFILESN